MSICFEKIIRAISLALDLSQISSIENSTVIEEISNIPLANHKFLNHSKRTTYIALKVGKRLSLPEESIKNLYIASLLHDIGAANSLNKSHTSSAFIKEHCIIGESIIKNLPIYSDISKIILYHHENFNGSGPLHLKDKSIPIESRIIHMADLLELLYRDNIPAYKQRSKIISWVSENTNTIFDSNVVKAFLSITQNDIFWFDLENIGFMDFILDNISPQIDTNIDLDQFEKIAYILSNIIDNKSKFTAEHSRGISKLSYTVSKYVGYPEEKCVKMRIAGLLHDIGKLAIPTSILDKNASLTDDEFSIIKSHVYYTKIILERIDGIDDIIYWASSHHEKLNGKGYPMGLTAKKISEECRILGVCDIYQALIENRPYRKGLSETQAFKILNEMANDGFICPIAVEQLKNALDS
ncbi:MULTISPECIES: HD-GYP domain-containing protein [Clostridium]|uniref:HD-GYP domain-containing protein n=1 Tax=Clostridium TaxID=1485 RepID=UPI00069F35D3|nr:MULTISPECIES: HD domain-containing phosphohydrolase [Clostridium]KOF57052.1 hydrolase [Clostridium sp. DMHC 10]MCD2347023.1 HD domain-containing protein [Clostridium guangxiense]